MSETVIRVENLGKRYQLGLVHHDRLADAVTAGVRWATGGLRRLFSRNGRASLHPRPSSLVSSTSTLDPRPSTHGRGTAPDDIWALRNVSFDVHRGEVLGIIGRNGSGKSTLLKILTGITEPTEGRAWIKGRVGSLLEVGTGFHPELTGRENIFLNGAILGMTRTEIRRKFDEIVDFAGIERFIDTPVKRYSSGMYVRLAFAIAAHLDPEVLLVDEVLAVGDAEFQRKCLGKMREITAGGGRTVLFVSHNMAAVQSLCSRTILLRDGAVAAIGDTRQIIAQYLAALDAASARPLCERSDREGDGSLRFTGLTVNNVKDPASVSVCCGDSLTFTLEYLALSRPSGLSLHLGILDGDGVPLLHCSTCALGCDLDHLGSHGRARCTIPRLPVAPGRYRINVAAMGTNGLLDRVENAAELRVEGGDFYGTGLSRTLHWSKCLVDHRWEVMGS
jgi:lipopolysaccharide transport system ATP-binding protein